MLVEIALAGVERMAVARRWVCGTVRCGAVAAGEATRCDAMR